MISVLIFGFLWWSSTQITERRGTAMYYSWPYSCLWWYHLWKAPNLKSLTARIAPLKIFRGIDVGGVDHIEVGAAPWPATVVGEAVDGQRVALPLQPAFDPVLEGDKGAELLRWSVCSSKAADEEKQSSCDCCPPHHLAFFRSVRGTLPRTCLPHKGQDPLQPA